MTNLMTNFTSVVFILLQSLIVSLWIATCVTCCAIVFGLYHYRDDGDMNRVLAVFYSSLHRPAWGLALGWVVYACATKNGGTFHYCLHILSVNIQDVHC